MTEPGPARLVLDPNVLVGAAISSHGPPALLLHLVEAGAAVMVVSPLLLQEVSEVLQREKFRRWIALEDVQEYLQAVALLSETVGDPTSEGAAGVCRDPDDDYLIFLAEHVQATTACPTSTHGGGTDSAWVRPGSPSQSQRVVATPLVMEVLLVSMWQQSQLERQARFWALIRQGKTNTAACEAVGVERRQGYRWRKAAGGRIPLAPRVVSGRFLSLEERVAIVDLQRAGEGVRAIASALGRSPSTISRELTRNEPAAAAVLGQRRRSAYAPYAAHKRAELRGRRPKPNKLEHRPLAVFVYAKMDLKWSPQQISDELARTHAGQVEMQVSHETIYQALYVQGRGYLRADLHKQLRTGRAMRRPRAAPARRRPP